MRWQLYEVQADLGIPEGAGGHYRPSREAKRDWNAWRDKRGEPQFENRIRKAKLLVLEIDVAIHAVHALDATPDRQAGNVPSIPRTFRPRFRPVFSFGFRRRFPIEGDVI